MRYYSKKDIWLSLTLWSAVILPLILIVISLMKNDMSKIEIMIVIPIIMMTDVFIVWVWFSTYYVITEDVLLIRFGPFRKTVKLDSIILIRKTSNPLSSPALSMRRIEIMYGSYNMTLISPKDRDHFISLLLKKCPEAKLKS